MPKQRTDDLIAIGQAMAKMRLIIGRRYIGRVALRELDGAFDLGHLDVLGVVKRRGRNQEVTIGLIADDIRIDHSRASRIVAELVRLGVVRREASQEDARRTIVALTESGRELMAQVDDTKHEVLDKTLEDWPAEDIATFARLYDRFTLKMEQQANDFDAECASARPDQKVSR